MSLCFPNFFKLFTFYEFYLDNRPSDFLITYTKNIHKNREKNLQFFGVNDLKIRWTVVEIKFIKGKKFKEIWEVKNQKVGLKILQTYIKIEKKICNFLV